MATTAYDVGDLRRLQTTFKDAAGTATDPTGVTFRMRAPDGVETAYVYLTDAQVVKSATGIYYVDWTFTKTGRHFLRWEATGGVVTAEHAEFWARAKVAG